MISPIEDIEKLTQNLPDPEAAARFFRQFSEQNGAQTKKLLKDRGLLSDVLTLVAFSPLFATTLLQNPQYVTWLAKQRREAKVRDKEELLESLARFSLTQSEIEPPVLLARFRRRELMRIYLRDIRRLGTIAEITEEISHLADAVLEYALRLARQETNNRFGTPLEIDEKGKAKQAQFCIVALGKLGSLELNYSSDIDLLFLYSSEGSTSGQGTRGAVTNREYFIKLSEFIVKLVGGQNAGEGAAYRVDLRLRPHGRVGALAISARDAAAYYQSATAQPWERQTLIRSRSSAGDAEIFKTFFAEVEDRVFSKNETVENALRNVRLSKEKINLEKISEGKNYNVKLGRGGIREIEFVAQALQLAYGGRDSWLRAPHTLISLSRLADRNLISESELTALADAYDFLRRLEHRLQMEHGLQTHTVPDEPEKLRLIAARMNCPSLEDFNAELKKHAANVSRIFTRIFGANSDDQNNDLNENFAHRNFRERSFNSFDAPVREDENITLLPAQIVSALEKADLKFVLAPEKFEALKKFCAVSPYFTEMIAANPSLIDFLPLETVEPKPKNYDEILRRAVSKEKNFRERLAALRIVWAANFLEIAAFDVFGKIELNESKRLQTELAEASLAVAFEITGDEIQNRCDFPADYLNLSILGLGKLGGRGMDYGSDLDLVLIFKDKEKDVSTSSLIYPRAAEIFLTTLSSFTREGHLYRVDLRLRPDGKNGAAVIDAEAFLNYLETRSAIWEWLAYVKLRGVGGELKTAIEIERAARQIIHRKALQIDKLELKSETLRVRERLEKERTRRAGAAAAKSIDIKFGAGGMLDVYFAARFLQLRDGVFDDEEGDRSTRATLGRLYDKGSLRAQNFDAFDRGYEFLSRLDHALRLTIGRTNRLPSANPQAMRIIVERMQFDSINELTENLTLHRLAVRDAFDNILR